MTVVPAYGRDYKSKAEILAHWNENKDFVEQPSGKSVNKQDAERLGLSNINFRYKGLRQVAVMYQKSPGDWAFR